MKRFVHVALLLLLGGNSCFALEATFSKEHACVPAGEHISSCEIIGGDSLSKDAIAVYGDWHLYPAIKDANPKIVHEDKIYAGDRINIPDMPAETAKLTSPTTEVASPDVLETVTMSEMVVMPKAFANPVNAPVPTVTLEQASAQTVAAVSAQAPINEKAMQSMKIAKITAYQFVAGNPDLQGPLQTQLILFNNEEEKKLGLPCGGCRIDLKPSIVVPAKDGDTVVFVRLKKLPAQPFELLVGGINHPIDSTQIQPYSGKIPGRHPFLHALVTIGKIGAQGGISFAVTGNPLIAAGVVGIPRLVTFVIAQHEKARERTLAAAQATVDELKIALYRANTESNLLSKEIPR